MGSGSLPVYDFAKRAHICALLKGNKVGELYLSHWLKEQQLLTAGADEQKKESVKTEFYLGFIQSFSPC